ncbi:substrate-binding domain-containing protein [Gluconobacter sphaericus]|uniref:Molybdate ABC transporter substrate-binding protein n=1 Tax=Gluconobacter sphaericus NBRC 12467 TaxID=1307951 RepID=A0AA37SFM7_9PROT|nr:substrate-binding domain-containing protein [Gluconobacter sphaericus]MBF0885207.1 substrate-binding domain-containing protein [Gluconobacter sphaericus]MBS1085095.1 substrate-binding domain-containing protein [Gluconobacter sphaericus]MBS1098687.1 substrate-binding domain-containing protein [Gluconobacter sphaericus]GBR55860.1 molybdate ABC transporter substrate-binding periplasmic protein [Gluconobacter sphaericus NBRC 12467]GEB43124.1 molybdate ABC transporter substrate-binding protein [
MSREQFSLSVALVVKGAFDDGILHDFMEKTGFEPVIEWAPTTVILASLEKGSRPDGVIVTDDALAGLVREGIVASDALIPLVASKIGIGVSSGAEHPDIATVKAFKNTLLNARSVAYSLGGQSGVYFAPLLERLGIAEAVNARATRIPSGFSAEKLRTGEADIAVQQVSELLAIEGTEIVGTFPEEIQKVTLFSGAPLVDSPQREKVEAFLSFLRQPKSTERFRKSGLEPQ